MLPAQVKHLLRLCIAPPPSAKCQVRQVTVIHAINDYIWSRHGDIVERNGHKITSKKPQGYSLGRLPVTKKAEFVNGH